MLGFNKNCTTDFSQCRVLWQSRLGDCMLQMTAEAELILVTADYHVFNIDLLAPAEPVAQAFAIKAFQGREWEDGCNMEAVADL